jgi:hypothetical protein
VVARLAAAVPARLAETQGCRGKAQKANGAIRLVVEQARDLTSGLRTVSGPDAALPLTSRRAVKRNMAAAALMAAIRILSPCLATWTSPICPSTR